MLSERLPSLNVVKNRFDLQSAQTSWNKFKKAKKKYEHRLHKSRRHQRESGFTRFATTRDNESSKSQVGDDDLLALIVFYYFYCIRFVLLGGN